MSNIEIEIPLPLLKEAKHPDLIKTAERATNFGHRVSQGSIELRLNWVSTEALEELLPMLETAGDTTSARALKAVVAYREGDYAKKIPNYKAFRPGLESFLQTHSDRGWVYWRAGDNFLAGYIDRVESFTPSRPDQGRPHTSLSVAFFAPGTRGSQYSMERRSWSWEPAEVTNKTIGDILVGAGIYLETPELNEKYDAEVERFTSDMANRFKEQVLIAAHDTEEDALPGGIRRAIHDMPAARFAGRPVADNSKVLDKEVPVPIHPKIFVFDLQAHSFHWLHVNHVQPYVYDPTLRDKLVLPNSHRELLDVLTSDLSVFSGDIIRGKSAGNIIVCKGLPGLGKTLTAEVYSELTETPIYSVHAGSLGVTAQSVEGSLKTIFKRQKRWGCIVLLDEADVFVKTRGDDLNQNAIVAEFLRTLEYFDGLMFMTTNRPDDIDDAIISRAAAIINYHTPSNADRRKIWSVMFGQNEITPPKSLIPELVEAFPTISARDIKMLLRLALRVSASKKEPLSIRLFRRVALFRAIEMTPEDYDDDFSKLI